MYSLALGLPSEALAQRKEFSPTLALCPECGCQITSAWVPGNEHGVPDDESVVLDDEHGGPDDEHGGPGDEHGVPDDEQCAKQWKT